MELVVSVIQARGLEPNRVSGTLDSYVKVWITPHQSGRFQTRVCLTLLVGVLCPKVIAGRVQTCLPGGSFLTAYQHLRTYQIGYRLDYWGLHPGSI